MLEVVKFKSDSNKVIESAKRLDIAKCKIANRMQNETDKLKLYRYKKQGAKELTNNYANESIHDHAKRLE